MRYFRYLAAALLSIGFGGFTAASDPWPIKTFVLQKLDPDSAIPYVLQRPEPFTPAQKATIADYEAYLSTVAADYEKMDFKPPKLPVVEGPDGQPAYQVFLFDYSDNDSWARVQLMPDLTTEMRLNLSRSFTPDGKAVPDVYDNLGHELFHAVQRAYQKDYDADLGNWIMEGQAQAVGMEMALEHKCIDLSAGKAEDYRLGGRGYFRPLSQPLQDRRKNQDEDYRTSSFWRYLAETHAAAAMNKRESEFEVDEKCGGVKRYEVDYSLFHKILSVEFKGPASQNADLVWLDKALRDTTKLSLRRQYSNFISRLVDYMPARMTRKPRGSVADAKKGWRDLLFGGCPHTINLTATATTGYDVVKLDRVASRCFQVKLFGEGKADIAIHVRTETPGAISSLLIGTAGGAQIGEPDIAPSPVGGGIMGRWKFRVDAGTEQTFVISNVAINPAESTAQDVLIEASTNYWDSTITNPRQQETGKKSGADPTPSCGRTSGDNTRSEGQKNVETGLKSLSNRTSSGTQVSQSPSIAKCADPFAETGCGPVTTINLALMPGAFGDLTMIGGTGGGLAQVMSQFVAIADNGAFATDAALQDAMQEMYDTEGSTVTITIPFIDYGFSGSFSNASIDVNGGKGKGTLQALGPTDVQIGPGRLFPRSGNVTIDEFTPYVLRGSYSAKLSDLSAVDFSKFGQDTPLPVDREIRGTFSIAAPWEGDPRVETFTAEGDRTDEALQDLYETFPAMRNFDLEALKAMAPSATEGSGQAGNLPSSPVASFPSCQCGCRIDREQPRACIQICKPAVLACGQEKLLEQKISTAIGERNALEADVGRMRQDFEDHLRAQGMDDAHIENALKDFDDKPSADEQRRLLMGLQMDVGSYGDDDVQRNAANPPKAETREEYIAKLEADPDLSDAQRERLISLMDEAWAELGGWPE